MAQTMTELSPNQLDALRGFYARCQREGVDTFTSDTFRDMGYPIYLDSGYKELGKLFGFMARHHWIRLVKHVRTTVPKSRKRFISQWEFTERGAEVLGA